MDKMEFARTLLVEKGISARLTKPYPYLLHRWAGLDMKPRIFESPLKLFALQAVLGSAFWGGFMWVLLWQFDEFSVSQVYASLFFGVGTGLLLAIEVARVRSKHGLTDLDIGSKQTKSNSVITTCSS
ncbi:DUF6404 family protein [Vibrio sp. LaRot3]|nr:DUF6404 family protein [Vibrio sp. LaRot3]MDA0148447.1 DUF6404 family protein [Vibrio sp. LaRot3]